MLSGYFVNYHVLRIFLTEARRDAIRSPNAEASDEKRQSDLRHKNGSEYELTRQRHADARGGSCDRGG